MEGTVLNKKNVIWLLLPLFLAPFVMAVRSFAQKQTPAISPTLAGLQDKAQVIRDSIGVPHVVAKSDHDAYFMLGYLHAHDRFFQMDVTRRRASGTLAELMGVGPRDRTLESDVQLRIMGIGRAAERSLKAYSPQFRSLLEAYAGGVNAWMEANPLPDEYAALKVTRAPRWTALDSVTVSKFLAFQLAFDFTDLRNTTTLERYKKVGQEKGFDGVKLFFDDVFRASPFDEAITVSEPGRKRFVQSPARSELRTPSLRTSPASIETASKFVDSFSHNPLLSHAELGLGSNLIVVSGTKTASGYPILANDPHLALGSPAIFYEVHLMVEPKSGPAMNVYGVSIAGAPGIIIGHNEKVAWGATSCPLDVTDFYSEKLVKENGEVKYTRFKDKLEPVSALSSTFKANEMQEGKTDNIITLPPGPRKTSELEIPKTFILVPRRNNGPLLPSGPDEGISVQFAGFSPSRELEALFAWARAKDIDDFKRGLQYFEFGAQNWGYADTSGNIAYFVGGKVPLREDLQAGAVDGTPPIFLRDGSGKSKHEWIAKPNANPDLESPYESAPFNEMPQEINPPGGVILNTNNDPLGLMVDNDPFKNMRASGQGIYYISAGFSPGFRGWKLASLINKELGPNGRGKISVETIKRLQSNVEMRDAEVLTPHIVRAMDAARAPGALKELAAFAADAAVVEAVGRLAQWDFTSPTGVDGGYDGAGAGAGPRPPTEAEARNSVATTIYNVWRSRILHNTIIAALDRVGLANLQPGSDRELVDLRYMLDNFSTKHGVGASGINFFEVPGVNLPPVVRRDVILLRSLKEALEQLAGEPFAAAFNKSTRQDDYRWGKLHRITFMHPFGPQSPQFSVPPAGSYQDFAKGLSGLSVDGGYETIDNGNFDGRSTGANGYVYGGGAACRYIAELSPNGIKAAQVLPGGQSGNRQDPIFNNQLGLWLMNRYHEVYFTLRDAQRNAASTQVFAPRK